MLTERRQPQTALDARGIFLPRHFFLSSKRKNLPTNSYKHTHECTAPLGSPLLTHGEGSELVVSLRGSKARSGGRSTFVF